MRCCRPYQKAVRSSPPSVPGLFTSGGHFIVLRGLTADGKVLVNDPNDSDSKNYVNRAFDMMTEIPCDFLAVLDFREEIEEHL